MRPIDGDRLMMHLTDWWFSSFGQVETDESKAIKTVIDKIDQTLGEFALEKQEQDKWHVVAEEGNPPKMGYYLWSANGGAVEIDFFDGEKWEKASTYLYEVLAWKYRPKAYTEEES